jgi:DNA replication and repair protein RecF
VTSGIIRRLGADRRRLDLLLGENGSGKTNWIEAAVLLSIGRSFRGARDRDLARRGGSRF